MVGSGFPLNIQIYHFSTIEFLLYFIYQIYSFILSFHLANFHTEEKNQRRILLGPKRIRVVCYFLDGRIRINFPRSTTLLYSVAEPQFFFLWLRLRSKKNFGSSAFIIWIWSHQSLLDARRGHDPHSKARSLLDARRGKHGNAR